MTRITDPDLIGAFQAKRHEALDQLGASQSWHDLLLIAALGEPSSWSVNLQGQPLPDYGASRLDMQPRQQGSNLIGSRLRSLARTVASRDPEKIVAGLCGDRTRDEIGHDRADSRTATGFTRPGATDNALAWCGLWGIAVFPLALRISTGRAPRNGPAITSGHIRGKGQVEWFYAPMWRDGIRLARLQTIVASEALRTAAACGLPLPVRPVSDIQVTQAHTWLAARRVDAVVRFPIGRFGSDKAPQRRALGGEVIPIGHR